MVVLSDSSYLFWACFTALPSTLDVEIQSMVERGRDVDGTVRILTALRPLCHMLAAFPRREQSDKRLLPYHGD